MKECLLLVDLQNDYFPGGKMELVAVEKAAANAQLILKAFRGCMRYKRSGIQRQNHKGDGSSRVIHGGTIGSSR